MGAYLCFQEAWDLAATYSAFRFKAEGEGIDIDKKKGKEGDKGRLGQREQLKKASDFDNGGQQQ